MISLGRRWDGVERDCERRDGCRVRWANGLGMDQGLLAACPPVSSRKTAFPDASIRSDHARRVRSGSEFELGLGGGSCRCDRWRPRRQTDAFEVGPDRGRLRQGSNDLHATAASGAFADVDRQHARQELAPGEAVRTRLAVGFAGRLGLVVGARHDPVAVSRVGPQDAVVANQVEPWRGYGSQFFEQLVGGQQQGV